MTPSSDGAGGGCVDLTAEQRNAPPMRCRHRLHNFSFPSLRWGAQRIMRCKSPATTAAAAHRKKPHPNAEEESHHTEAGRSPWNLRTRRFRSSGNAPPPPPSLTNHNAKAAAIDGKNRSNSVVSNSPSPEEKIEEKKGSVRARFSVSLTREEIEEDFLMMKGTKPQRRPKKRARIVQRKLDRLFPGLWLFEITADSYKTND